MTSSALQDFNLDAGNESAVGEGLRRREVLHRVIAGRGNPRRRRPGGWQVHGPVASGRKRLIEMLSSAFTGRLIGSLTSGDFAGMAAVLAPPKVRSSVLPIGAPSPAASEMVAAPIASGLSPYSLVSRTRTRRSRGARRARPGAPSGARTYARWPAAASAMRPTRRPRRRPAEPARRSTRTPTPAVRMPPEFPVRFMISSPSFCGTLAARIGEGEASSEG